ncbi:MAG TPA: ABC transporter permease [Spirochaetales bacterium]|nr:ABC transporter permease [Spirochaetales bacterium]HRY55711.1 ABC transporter permease [Spirochaetia bacterium]HRZ65257.1 ABC transporter permease [Spirochaetia bacterium]
MRRAFLRRLLGAALTVLGVLAINYFLFRVMPGDPVAMLVRNPKMTAEALARTRASLGLDRPWHEQFRSYLAGLARADLGSSFIFKRPVLAVIGERLLPTLLLTLVAEALAIAGGMLVGIVSAWKRGTKADVLGLGFTLLAYSMPTFWLGILLVALFAGRLGLFPVSGMLSPGLAFAPLAQRLGDVLTHLALPSITLALVLMGEYALIMRNAMIEVLTEDYIVTARAKGLSERGILRRHALPNAMIPMTTLIAMSLGFAITGALQVETVFSWPGLGRLMYEALKGRDYPLLQGIFLVTSVCVVGANFAADILYRYIDPRVRD